MTGSKDEANASLDAVAEATNRAQVAMLNLVRMMAAHSISRAELGLILPSAWPETVRKAFTDLDAQLRPLARLIARAEGVETWETLPMSRRSMYASQAYERVMDSPVPEVPHASGLAPMVP